MNFNEVNGFIKILYYNQSQNFIIGRAEKNFPWGLHVGLVKARSNSLVKDRESSSQHLIMGKTTKMKN